MLPSSPDTPEEDHLTIDALDEDDVYDYEDEIETIGKDSGFDTIED
jgi:hypothetical protein